MEKNKINNTNTNLKYFEDTIKLSEIEFNKEKPTIKEEIDNEVIEEDIDFNIDDDINKQHDIIANNNVITQTQPISPSTPNTNDNETDITSTNDITTDSTNNNNKEISLYQLKYDDSYNELDSNGNKKQRIKQINFYKTDGSLSYFELFNYYKDNRTSSEERSISKLYHGPENKVNNNLIAYRYYKDGNNNIQKDNYFTSVKNNITGEFDILENNTDCLSIIKDVIHNNIKDKEEYEISGNLIKSIGFLSALKHKEFDNKNIELKYNKLETVFNSFGKSNTTPIEINNIINSLSDNENKKVIILPVIVDSHASLLMITQKNNREFYLMDTSLYHCIEMNEKGKKILIPREDIFGKDLSKNIKVLINKKLQISGSCSYWVDSFCEYITNNKDIKDNKSIQKEFNNFMMLEVVKVFENNFIRNNERMFIEFNKKDKKNIEEKYYVLKNNNYCLNKDFHKNKFINTLNLVLTSDFLKKDILNHKLYEKEIKNKIIISDSISDLQNQFYKINKSIMEGEHYIRVINNYKDKLNEKVSLVKQNINNNGNIKIDAVNSIEKILYIFDGLKNSVKELKNIKEEKETKLIKIKDNFNKDEITDLISYNKLKIDKDIDDIKAFKTEIYSLSNKDDLIQEIIEEINNVNNINNMFFDKQIENEKESTEQKLLESVFCSKLAGFKNISLFKDDIEIKSADIIIKNNNNISRETLISK